MSRIQPLQVNSYRGNTPLTKSKKNINFTALPEGWEQLSKEGKADLADSILINDITDKVKSSHKKTKKFLTWLNNRDGEIQNQEINAVFTTTLAPLFIAWNPFASQDKKTKEYTALRQPISALIAISGGLGMTIGINNFLDTVCSEGYLKSIDLRMKPQKNYLKRQFNKEYASLKTNEEKQAFLNKYKPAAKDLAKDESLEPTKINKKTLKKVKNVYIDYIQKERTNLFANLNSEKPENLVFNEKTKTISLKKNGEMEEIGKNIPHIDTKKDFNAYLDSHNLYKLDFKNYMKENYNFDFFKDGSLKSYSINTELSNVKAMDFLRGLGLGEDGRLKEEDLIRVLVSNRQPQAAAKINKKLNADSEEYFQALLAETAKQDARVGQLMTGENNLKIEKISLKQMFDLLKISNDPSEKPDKLLQKYLPKGENGECETQTLQNFMDLKTNKVSEYFIDLFKTHKVKGFENDTVERNVKNGVKETIPKFKDCGIRMTERIAKRLSGDFKNNSKYAGIFFNLFTTAITCTILNWVYPRAVALFFPSLVKDDAAKKVPAQNVKGGN